MLDPDDPERPIRVGLLFSGYGGLDLAVEYALGAETVWFSENNEHVSRIFAHHWAESRTWATEPRSTGTRSLPLMCCAEDSPVRTCPQ
jgi:site-specific DNA-cytosine methylase